MQDWMHGWICQQNIKLYSAHLAGSPDENQKVILRKLLAEEEAKLFQFKMSTLQQGGSAVMPSLLPWEAD